MAALTFTIDPGAVLTCAPAKPKTTRDALWDSQNKPPRRRWLAGMGLSSDSKTIEPAKDFSQAQSTSYETSLPTALYPGGAIERVKHSTYKKYLISTTLRLNGTWVASFGLPGKLGRANSAEFKAVAETQPYLAEALAVADAKIEIDDRRKSPDRPHCFERRKASSRRRIERVVVKAPSDVLGGEYVSVSLKALGTV